MRNERRHNEAGASRVGHSARFRPAHSAFPRTLASWPRNQLNYGYEHVSRSCPHCRARRDYRLAHQPRRCRHPLFHRLARLHHSCRLRAAYETGSVAAADAEAPNLEHRNSLPGRELSAGGLRGLLSHNCHLGWLFRSTGRELTQPTIRSKKRSTYQVP